MSILSTISFGLIKPKDHGLLWVLDGVEYKGTGVDWLGHLYVARFSKGFTTKEVRYNFATHKDIRRVIKLASADAIKMNAAQ